MAHEDDTLWQHPVVRGSCAPAPAAAVEGALASSNTASSHQAGAQPLQAARWWLVLLAAVDRDSHRAHHSACCRTPGSHQHTNADHARRSGSRCSGADQARHRGARCSRVKASVKAPQVAPVTSSPHSSSRRHPRPAQWHCAIQLRHQWTPQPAITFLLVRLWFVLGWSYSCLLCATCRAAGLCRVGPLTDCSVREWLW
jgi:hypothetical protein